MKALKSLHQKASSLEKFFEPKKNLNALIEKERQDSYKFGGRTVFGVEKPPVKKQLSLFD